VVHHRDELKNFSVLSQGTYWLYQLHSGGFMLDSTLVRELWVKLNFTGSDLVAIEFKS